MTIMRTEPDTIDNDSISNDAIDTDASQTTGIDPRDVFARAVAVAMPVVGATEPHQYGLPTPCSEFDVARLLGHLLFAMDRAAAVGRGDGLGLEDEIDKRFDTGTDWDAVFRSAAAEVAAAWADDSRLTAMVDLPWASMTGADALSVYINELTVHTWDLAQATGRPVEWDEEVVVTALAAIRGQLPIADRDPIWQSFLADAPAGMAFAAPFANAVDLGDGRSLIDQLVAWNGRRP